MWPHSFIVSLFLFYLARNASALDGNISPLRYDIQIQLPTASQQDALIPAFFGFVRIDFMLTKRILSKDQYIGYRKHKAQLKSYQVRNNGVSFALDAVNLTNFENVTLEGDGRIMNISNIKILKEKVVFFLPEHVLNPGKYSLKIERYSGVITYDHGIFYREAGENPVLTTQLFPANAKSVFPCIDDIGARATFKLALIHPHHTIAISSTIPQESPSSLNANWKITKFVETSSISPYMLAFAVLPIEYNQITTGSKLPINIFSNRLQVDGSFPFELANLTGQIYDEVSQILNDNLPLAQLNILLVDEAKPSRSFGLLTMDRNSLRKADRTSKIYMITKAIVQQWFGGILTVPTWQEFCIQDDIAEYLTTKVIKSLAKDKETYDLFRLSTYLKVQLAETFFAPGEGVTLSHITHSQIESRCGLKGAVMLESLETVVGENAVLTAIRRLTSSKHRSFHFRDFTESFRSISVDKNINIAMVLDFWNHNGGQPLLSVTRNETLISLRQMNIALDMAPISKKIVTLVNLGYQNHYRVNYDAEVWNTILQKMTTSELNSFSPRMRAQLVGDFCYFNSLNLIDKSKAEDLRQGFLQIMRRHVDSFPLCEFYAFWCVGGHQKRISLRKERKALIEEHVESTFASLSNQKEYACGANLRPTQAASKLCNLAFGVDCM
ncbi:hypothetical protein QR680_001231 [Steinernema hermaphroditum]|uniref:Aminopeptidase n=1 Tax=Steinernema hermaphroditum TaxID=289476 RepID=A0AA39GXE6_9BILA|nr:hypothetical protein QR680_001231 [Steinernema hermaphroditum]